MPIDDDMDLEDKMNYIVRWVAQRADLALTYHLCQIHKDKNACEQIKWKEEELKDIQMQVGEYLPSNFEV